MGTGESLNEHILGDHWPPTDIRLEMLEEAVEDSAGFFEFYRRELVPRLS